MVLSNGPGDPKKCQAALGVIRRGLERTRPILGICLGHQLLGLAAGADTFKLKYGHRGQNQPCIEVGTKRCYITSQNHGYAVNDQTLPAGWQPWFFNANDGTNEGMRHRERPFLLCAVPSRGATGAHRHGLYFRPFRGGDRPWEVTPERSSFWAVAP